MASPMLRTTMAAMAAFSVLVGAARAAEGPTKGFDLRRLEALNSRQTPEEAARVYLTYLQEEVASPSPPRAGLGGGTITHEYVLAQIILAGARSRMPRAAALEAASKAAPGEFQDGLRLTLGLMGEKSVVPFLVSYLGDASNDPFLRERAARAFHHAPDRRAIPVLASMLQDPYFVVTYGPGPCRKRYDLRATARTALLSIRTATGPLPAEVQRALGEVVTEEPYTPPPTATTRQ